MAHPEQGTYPTRVRFVEVEPAARLIYEHLGESDETLFRTHVRFEPDDAGTMLTLTMTFPTAEARQHALDEVGAVEGGTQTLHRLSRILGEALKPDCAPASSRSKPSRSWSPAPSMHR